MQQAVVSHLLSVAAMIAGTCCTSVHPQVYADFLDGLKYGTDITVFPAAVRAGASVTYDEDAALLIAEHLDAAGVAARAATAHVALGGGWRVNEARLARESASALAAHIGAEPIAGRYALLPEYLKGGGGVGAVHVYVVRDDGVVAAMLVLNSHSELFAAADPREPIDCTALVIKAIDQNWMSR